MSDNTEMVERVFGECADTASSRLKDARVMVTSNGVYISVDGDMRRKHTTFSFFPHEWAEIVEMVEGKWNGR